MREPSPAYRLVLVSFLWSFGGNLVYFFLNFHLEALGFSRQAIGLAQALLLFTGVVFALPLAYLIPRLGYLKSLYLAFSLAVGSGLLLGLGLWVFPSLAGYGLAGALLQGAAAPFMAWLVPPEKRVALFSLQAALTTRAASSPPSLRALFPTGWGPVGPPLRPALLSAGPSPGLGFRKEGGRHPGFGAALGYGSGSFCPRWSSGLGRGSSSPF